MANATADALHQHYADNPREDWRRDHLGCSQLGRECDRELWYGFRWASEPGHDGRMLRLFERGKIEESWVIDDLRDVGVQVNGEQDTVRWGHVGGSLDGRVLGLLEAPEIEHVLEVKTSNAKKFEELLAKGVKRAKHEHFVQMQLYMLGTGIKWAFYVCVCKDDDRIYTERVPFVEEVATQHLHRGQRIATLLTPPERKSLDATSPPCSWCSHKDVCHGSAFPLPSCRTCIEAMPTDAGTWWCGRKQRELSPEDQRAGCSDHVTCPAMVNRQVVTVDEAARRVVYQAADGARVVDGAMRQEAVA